ncbi:MAG TPA: hypothetical protein VIJ12_07875 [Candidatus Baltobacteraceae bacterium]
MDPVLAALAFLSVLYAEEWGDHDRHFVHKLAERSENTGTTVWRALPSQARYAASTRLLGERAEGPNPKSPYRVSHCLIELWNYKS